jgi:hypothetical protein
MQNPTLDPARRTPRRAHRTLVAAATLALLAACSSARHAPLTVADWCWLHYRFAPADALRGDTGPTTVADADRWITWLSATADAPPERRPTHRRQQELVERFATSGDWTAAERADYVSAAHAEPTAATVCETVGARIVPDDDGSLPSQWELRFRDRDDPAHSVLAEQTGAAA